MRLIKKSPLRRLASHLRYVIARLWHFRGMRGAWNGIIDSDCSIFVLEGGSIRTGKRLCLSKGSELQARGELVLGNNVFLNQNTRIVSFERITIGDDCLFGAGITVLDHDHATEFDGDKIIRGSFQTAPIAIGNNVWVGEKVTILRGVTIGDNTTIAAHAVVTRDIPANCIAGGMPAKPIRELGNQT